MRFWNAPLVNLIHVLQGCFTGQRLWIYRSYDSTANDAKRQAKQNNLSWWRHQMETFSALLAICAGNSQVPSEFLAQRPVTRSFDVFFDLRLNKRLSKQSWGWWFETLSRPSWRHRNSIILYITFYSLSYIRRFVINSREVLKMRDIVSELPIALNLDRPLGSIAAETYVKFQSDTTILILNLADWMPPKAKQYC